MLQLFELGRSSVMLNYQNLLVILHLLSARHDLACCEKSEELALELNLLNKSLNGNPCSIKARDVFGMSYNFELCLFLMHCNDHVALTLCFTLHPKPYDIPKSDKRTLHMQSGLPIFPKTMAMLFSITNVPCKYNEP